MKQLILIFAVFALTANVFGQDENTDDLSYGNRIGAGTVLLSGNVSYEKSSSDVESYKLNVGGEFALSKRIAVALGFGYKNTSEYTYHTFYYENKQKEFSVVPGFTLFGDVSYGWLQPRLNISIPIGFGKHYGIDSNGQTLRDVPSTSISGVISPGLNIFLSKRLALTASLGFIKYTSIKFKYAEGEKSSFGIGLSPADLSLGLLFVFGAK